MHERKRRCRHAQYHFSLLSFCRNAVQFSIKKRLASPFRPASGLKEEPRSPFGLVDPIFEQTRAGKVVILVVQIEHRWQDSIGIRLSSEASGVAIDAPQIDGARWPQPGQRHPR